MKIFRKSKKACVTFFASFIPTFWQKKSFVGPFVDELMRFEAISQKSRLKLTFTIPTLKAIGGGPGPKYDDFSVRCICLANFLYFQPLFTEFKKNSPLAQKMPIRSRRYGYFLTLFSWKGHENQRNTGF